VLSRSPREAISAARPALLGRQGRVGRLRRLLPLWRVGCAAVLLLLLAAGGLEGMQPGEPEGAHHGHGSFRGLTADGAIEEAATTPSPNTAAPADTIVEVRLTDGSVFHGRIVQETETLVVIETAGGARVELPRERIQSMAPARGQIVDGRFWPADPTRSRLLFAPSARPMLRGEAYVANYMLFFPFVAYGLSDRFSIAGGTPLFPEIIGEVFYLAPKYTLVSGPGMDVAVGTLALFLTRELDRGSFGIVYGVGTFGDADRALTAGAGWGFRLSGDDAFVSDEPVLVLGGETRTGARTKLLSEGWFVLGNGASGVLSGGVRFFGDRLSGDLGLGVLIDDGVECCAPVLNFVFGFGGGR